MLWLRHSASYHHAVVTLCRHAAQAVLEDMPELLSDEPQLLDALRAGDGAAGGGGGGSPPRARLARAAAAAGAQLGKLLYLTEHLLAVLYTHLRLCLPAPALGAPSPDKGGMLAYGAANGGADHGQPSLQTLGSERVRPRLPSRCWQALGRCLSKRPPAALPLPFVPLLAGRRAPGGDPCCLLPSAKARPPSSSAATHLR